MTTTNERSIIMPDQDRPTLDYEAVVNARASFRQQFPRLLAEGRERGGHGVHYGLAAEACRAADEAIFHALNTLGAYAGDTEAARCCKMRAGYRPPSGITIQVHEPVDGGQQPPASGAAAAAAALRDYDRPTR